MATSGVINGTNFRLYVNGAAIGYSTNCTLSSSTEIKETIHKDNGGAGNRSITLGTQSHTISVSAFLNYDAATVYSGKKDADDIAALKLNRTRIAWAMKGASGDDRYNGEGYITEFSIDASAEEDATYDFTIEVDGAIELGNVT